MKQLIVKDWRVTVSDEGLYRLNDLTERYLSRDTQTLTYLISLALHENYGGQGIITFDEESGSYYAPLNALRDAAFILGREFERSMEEHFRELETSNLRQLPHKAHQNTIYCSGPGHHK